jgi:hypothetical protein
LHNLGTAVIEHDDNEKGASHSKNLLLDSLTLEPLLHHPFQLRKDFSRFLYAKWSKGHRGPLRQTVSVSSVRLLDFLRQNLHISHPASKLIRQGYAGHWVGDNASAFRAGNIPIETDFDWYIASLMQKHDDALTLSTGPF